jgi:haloalkane dehalogenase
MHYVDEGPSDGPVIVLLHGEPTWSYLYRNMIGSLVAGGYRALAPVLIGFGRSDKPSRIEDYTYLRHVEWVTSWFDTLCLRDVTLFVQDWGSLIGLRIAGERDDLAGRIVVSNGTLPIADHLLPLPFRIGGAVASLSPVIPCGRAVSIGTVRKVPAQVRAGYDAPFPDRRLVPTKPNDPAVPANRAAWAALGRWEKPFLCVFGARDPILGQADRALIDHVPGAKGQPHARIMGGHFVQEDCGAELAGRILAWPR